MSFEKRLTESGIAIRRNLEGMRCTIPAVLLALVLLVTGDKNLVAQEAQTAAEATSPAEPERLVIVVRGASGTSEYGRLFDSWCDRWRDAADRGNANFIRIGSAAPGPVAAAKPSDRDLLKTTFNDFAETSDGLGGAELWVVLVGHGTFDGRTARFNLRGPDVTADELASWLEAVSCPIVIANCASASAPFLKPLAGPNRVVMTATKSGAEVNFARLGEYLSQAIGDASFDLDKDGQTSLFEAYLSASRRTQEFYDSEGRLATEHALLDDNGDGQGVRANLFRGVRQVGKVKGNAVVDGRLAHQFHLVRSDVEQKLSPQARRTRDQLEQAVIELRDRKSTFANEDAYYAQLEPLLIQLATFYAAGEQEPDQPELTK